LWLILFVSPCYCLILLDFDWFFWVLIDFH
jgi:hypothetical protein